MTDFSYQLYSSRKFPPLGDTLSMLAEIGYAEVEGYGALFGEDTDLGAMKADLDRAGLTMPTAHVSVDIMRDAPEEAIAIAHALGLNAVIGPFLQPGERPTTAAGWTAFGTQLGEIAKPLQDAGLKVAWHNHDFEFTRVDGALPMDLILEAAPDLLMEFDVAWCVKGGEDPLAWIAAYGDRILAGHIKDIAAPGDCEDEDGWADVGEGTMDWPAYMAALRATPCRHFIAEHDNPNDHRRFATRSLAAMQGL